MIEFSQFWQNYPRKTNRAKAEVTWGRLSTKDKQLAYDDIADRYNGVEKGLIPHATTYLNGKRWEDEKIEASSGTNETRQARHKRIFGYLEEKIEEATETVDA